MHRQLLDLRARGGGVLLISEDLEELPRSPTGSPCSIRPSHGGPADRQATVERVGLLMAGVMERPGEERP